MDVRVALEQFTGSDGMRDSILFIYYMFHEEKKVRSAWDLKRITHGKERSCEGKEVFLIINYDMLLFWESIWRYPRVIVSLKLF